MTEKKTYEVGYCKPPKHSQFSSGRSGNLKGRPKGSRNIRSIVTEFLDGDIVVQEGLKKRRISRREATINRLFQLAMKGDLAAFKELIKLDNASLSPDSNDEGSSETKRFTWLDIVRSAQEEDKSGK